MKSRLLNIAESRLVRKWVGYLYMYKSCPEKRRLRGNWLPALRGQNGRTAAALNDVNCQNILEKTTSAILLLPA